MSGYQRPALTWEYVLDWAKQNKVPETAVVTDEDGHPLKLGYVSGTRIVFTTRDVSAPQTWGNIKATTSAAGGDGPDQVYQEWGVTELRRLVDLGSWEEGKDEWYLILQRKWG